METTAFFVSVSFTVVKFTVLVISFRSAKWVLFYGRPIRRERATQPPFRSRRVYIKPGSRTPLCDNPFVGDDMVEVPLGRVMLHVETGVRPGFDSYHSLIESSVKSI